MKKMILTVIVFLMALTSLANAQEEDEWGPLITPDQSSAIRKVVYDIMPLDNGDVLFGGEFSFLVHSPTESQLLETQPGSGSPVILKFAKQGNTIFTGAASGAISFRIDGARQVLHLLHPDGGNLNWATTDLIIDHGFIFPHGLDVWIRGRKHNYENTGGVVPLASKISPGAP